MAGSNDPFLLQLAYSNAFKNFRLFIEMAFPLDECLDILLEKEVITEECRRNIVAAKDIDEEREILVEHLQSKNKVAVYDKFLSICDTMQPKLANDIKDIIDDEKTKVGLSPNYHSLPRNNIDSETTDATNNSSNTDGEEYLLLVAYSRGFKNVRAFIEANCTVNEHLLNLQDIGIIDKDCCEQISNEKKNSRKAEILLNYLGERKEVERFKAFIEYFMEKEPDVAKLISKQIDYQKERVGLRVTERLPQPRREKFIKKTATAEKKGV